MAATERLKDFPVKASPTGADIVFLGDASNLFIEVRATISSIITGYSPALASIAGLTTAANQMIYTTASNTYAVSSITAYGRSLVAAVDASAAQTLLGLVIGADVQAHDNALDSISSLSTIADQMIYTTATNVYATTAITAFGRTLVGVANAPAALTTLGALPTAGGTMTGFLTLHADPTSALHAATKQYVDNSIGGTGIFLRVANNLSDVANASTSRTNLGLAIGTNVQAYDATLQSLSALGTAADKYAYTTGIDTWAEGTITSFTRTLLDDVDASTFRSTLGLGTAALLNTPITAPNGGTGVASPTAKTIPVAQGASAFTFIGPLTNGQFLIGSTGADPIANTISAGTNIVVTPGAGTLQISTTTGLTTTANSSFNTALTGTSLISIGGGAQNDGTGGSNQLEFQYGGSSPGGYRHFIKTWHEGLAGSVNNRIQFYLNNSTTAGGSSTPGTGNVLGMEIYSTGISIPGTLAITGNTTFTGTLGGTGSNIDIATGHDLRLSTTGVLSLGGADESYYLKYDNSGVRLQGFNNVLLGTGLTGANEGGLNLSSAWGPRIYIGGATGGYATAKDRLEVAGGIKLGTAIGDADGSPGTLINGVVHWNGTNFQGRKGDAWINLDETVGTNPSFQSVAITNTTNQLVLGTTNTITISSVAPATTSRVLTIPDPTANAQFMLTNGAAQTVTGQKDFTTITATTAIATTLVTNTITSSPTGGTIVLSDTLQPNGGMFLPVVGEATAGTIWFDNAVRTGAIYTRNTSNAQKEVVTDYIPQNVEYKDGSGALFVKRKKCIFSVSGNGSALTLAYISGTNVGFGGTITYASNTLNVPFSGVAITGDFLCTFHIAGTGTTLPKFALARVGSTGTTAITLKTLDFAGAEIDITSQVMAAADHRIELMCEWYESN